MKLSKMIKPELEQILLNANFTENEEQIFIMLSKGYSIKMISERLCMSEKTISRRIHGIKDKMERIKET